MGLWVAAIVTFFGVQSVSAVSPDNGVQSYAASTPINTGTIVRIDNRDSRTIGPVAQADAQQAIGVAIDRAQLSLRLSDEGLANETYVAGSGTYSTLVSTQNGAIAPGDYVTISAIDGVAMKAGLYEEHATVVGRAQGAFDGKGVVLGVTNLKDGAGKDTKTVQLGLIPVTIDVKTNPNKKEEISTKANLPEQLQRVGEQIAEKEVNPIRIYLSIAIMNVSLLAAIVVLYAGVRSGVISIGRNPMSKKSIFRAILEVIFTGLLIVIVGLFAVYLLLKL